MADPDPTESRHDPPVSPSTPTNGEPASVGDVMNSVVTYAKQETIGPLRPAGRWLAYGSAGALLLGLGSVLLLVGLLRLLQTEWTRSATGSLSWLSYLIVLMVGAVLVALTISRIRKTSFYPTDKETP